VKQGIKDARYLGVSDNRILKLYKPPPFDAIRGFAISFDPKLVFTPSQLDKVELNMQASKILGKPEKTIKLDFPESDRVFISSDNLLLVRITTEKYKINLD